MKVVALVFYICRDTDSVKEVGLVAKAKDPWAGIKSSKLKFAQVNCDGAGKKICGKYVKCDEADKTKCAKFDPITILPKIKFFEEGAPIKDYKGKVKSGI